MEAYRYGGRTYVPHEFIEVAKEGDIILLDKVVHRVGKVLHQFRNITDLQLINWMGTQTRYNVHATEYKILVADDTHSEAMSDMSITHSGKDYVLCKIPARVGDHIRTEDKRVWEVLQKDKKGLVLLNGKEGKQWSANYSDIGSYHVLIPRDPDDHTPTKGELSTALVVLQKLIDRGSRNLQNIAKEITNVLTSVGVHNTLTEKEKEYIIEDVEATMRVQQDLQRREKERDAKCKTLKTIAPQFSGIDTDYFQIGKAYLIGGAGMMNVHGLCTGVSSDNRFVNFLIVEPNRVHRTLTVNDKQLSTGERHIVDLEIGADNE
ncbi:hypothetical protein Goe16_02020 [Bacillus phage vB_BsuM-Goe16]|nr:hypothetical protein Goe16_00080 [Bacillus phage vB_BsuM-Goe16]WCS68616.1 hypothetical protein Goe16_02020 [Bacillus phage vB_BsuM-Goe16]